MTRWFFFLLASLVTVWLPPRLGAVNPPAHSTSLSSDPSVLTPLPGNILAEDGEIILPAELSTNATKIILGEPLPKDLAPTEKSKQKAEALALYSEGLALESKEDFDQALAVFEKVVALDPDFVDLRIKIGFEYLQREESSKAENIFIQVIQDKPDHPSGYTALALVKKMAGNNEEAIRLAKKAIELNPEMVAPYQYLYEIYLEQQRYVECINLLDEAAKKLPDNSFFWLRLGDMYANVMSCDPELQTVARCKRLEEIYSKAAEFDPENPEILQRMGDLLIDMKEYSKARDIFNRLLALDPEASRVREKLAYCYGMEGDHKMAISILESILQRNPSRSEIHDYIGQLRLETGDYDIALSHFEKSIEINQSNYNLNPVPNSPFLPTILSSYLQIALVHLQKKNAALAHQTLDKASQQFPNNPRIFYFRALIYREQKDSTKSIESFQEAEKNANEDKALLNSNFYHDFASAYELAKNYDQAIEALKKSIALDPQNDEALNFLAYLWADLNIHLDQAKELIEYALELSPGNGAYLDTLGWIYFRKGDYPKALEYLKESAAIVQYKDDIVLNHLAQTYEQLGDYAEALKWWKKALEIVPDSEQYKRVIENFEDRIKSIKDKKKN